MNGNRGGGNPIIGAGAPNGSLQQQQQQQQQQRRVNKTLGWYIGDIIERRGDERDSPSPTIRPFAQAQVFQQQQHHHQRKDSLGSESSHGSSIRNTAGSGSFSSANELEYNHHPRSNGRGRGVSNATPMATPPRKNTPSQKPKAPTSNTNTNKENTSTDGAAPTTATSIAPGPPATGQRKEDYWYYDPVSDGFYYESNGSRGWRKRNAKLHGSPMALIQSAANASVQKAQSAIEVAAAAVHAQQQAQLQAQMKQQTSKFFPNGVAAGNGATTAGQQQLPSSQGPAQPNVPSIKYYDAASDGFFFEMASVDGWRRRQPVTASAPPPVSLPNSYGASMMVHQQPIGQFHHPQQQQPHSQQQRIFRPLQPTQMHQQQAKPFGSPPNAFHQHPYPHPQMAPPKQGDYFMPINSVASGCTCHHAPVAAVSAKVIQPPRALRQQVVVGREVECPSSPSTAMSSSLSDASPPPPQQQQQVQPPVQRQEKVRLSMEIDSNGNIQQPQQQPMAMLTQLPHQQQHIPIGSFEEPYEFYWSDTEKTLGGDRTGSMASSMDDFGPPVRRDRENSLSEYFRELCGMGPGPEEQRDSSSAATTATAAAMKHQRQASEAPPTTNVAVKRPDTLRLSFSMNANANGKNANGVSNLPNFNVDQFIADLPNIVDHEAILKNLSALRTPMVESAGSRSFDPMLYTPIHAKDTAVGMWDRPVYGQQQIQPPPAPQVGKSADSAKLELNLQNISIEKIWQCPAF